MPSLSSLAGAVTGTETDEAGPGTGTKEAGRSSLSSVKMIKCDCVKCGTSAGPIYMQNQDEMMVGSCVICHSLGPFNISYTWLPENINSWRNTQLNLLIGNSGTVSGSSILSPVIHPPQIKIINFACNKCGYNHGPYYLQQRHQLTVGSCVQCKSLGPFNLSSSMMTANKTVYTFEWLRNENNKLIRINAPCPGDTSCENVPSIMSVETVEVNEETPDAGVSEKDILKQSQETKSEAKSKSGSSFCLRSLLDTDSEDD